MASETHGFITGPLLVKLKEDVGLLRAANTPELFAAAAFHVRRLMLTRAGWACRALCPPGRFAPELVLTFRDEFQALVRCDFAVRSGAGDEFPADRLNDQLASLRSRLGALEGRRTGAAYLFGAFDAGGSWFYPDEAMWEKQSCFWLPINCRELKDYADWRARYDRLARSPLARL